MKNRRIISFSLILVILTIALAFSMGSFGLEDGSGLVYTQSGAGYVVSGISDSCGATVTIPSTYNGKPVIGINERVFENQTGIETVSLPSTLTSIGKFAFSGCSKLKTINFPNGMTSIGLGAFYNCTSLTDVNLPSSITSIGDWAFYNCRGITKMYLSSCSLGIGVFSNCTNLKDVSLAYGITSIPMYLFESCYDLAQIELPASVSSVGQYAFADNYNLKNIILNNPGISIASNSFYDVKANVYYTCTSDWSSFNKDNYGGSLSYRNHAHVDYYPYKAATNTDFGNIEYWYCKDCDRYFSDASGSTYINKASTVIQPIEYILGDVNASGAVDSDDAIHLLYYTIYPEQYAVNQSCDFDGDGYETSDDAIYLLYYTLFPEEYPIS